MPSEKKPTRKLSAILSADVKGYSILMADDEVHTIETLKAYRQIISDLVSKHSGRVVDSPGDNILAEFRSVIDAVQCAAEIQKQLKQENERYADDKKVQFRIGVNIGDVIQDGGRIYGHGVNVAARIEGIADPGGISISRNAYGQVKDKLKFGYEYQGEHEVKNIRDPIKVYKILMDPKDSGKLIGEKRILHRKKWPAIAVAGMIILVGIIIWQYYNEKPHPIEAASVEKMAYPLPDKPSIAVLAFDNLSDDPDQEYFCDGLSEGIINALAKNDRLLVIARNSTFSFKGTPTKVKQIAEDLGVRYVVEGSIQKVDEKVRITVQLIDALSGYHLFSERYDRELKDILNLQDEITKKVLTAVQVKLTLGEAVAFHEKGTDNLEAYLKVMRARDYKNSEFNRERVLTAMQLLEDAIALDPEYASAYSFLATAHFDLVLLGASDDPTESLKTAIELGNKAIVLDESNPSVHANLAFIYMIAKNIDKAFEEAEKAVSIAPNSAAGYFALGFVYANTGRYQEAIPALEKCLRLSPIPVASNVLVVLGNAYRHLGNYEEAIAIFKKALHIFGQDQLYVHLQMALTYVQMDLEEEAKAAATDVLRIDPDFSIARALKPWPMSKDQNDRIAVALQKAGLPYEPALPLPDKPSIAVLAFDNLSGDPEQEYFSDGIAENIITALSKVGELFVIARNSSFTYKGKPVKVQQVGRELGVRYVLEGSIQKAGDRVRITAQLVDAKNGQHLWADKYDRDLKDIFEIQDEITLKIVNGLQIQLTEGEHARIWSKHNCSLGAYLKATEAQSIRHKGTKEAYIRYGQIGQEIVEAEPECLMGYSILAWYNATIAPFSKSPKEFYEKAFKYAQKGLSIDDSDPSILRNAGLAYLMKREYEKAIEMGQRAVNMAPNGAEFHAMLGFILSYAGMPDKGIVHGNQAIRLDPFPQVWPYATLGRCHLFKGQYDKSLEAYRKALKISPDNTTALGGIIAVYSMLGREEDAHREAKRLLELVPGLNVALLNFLPLKNQEDRNLFINAWLKAGIPDKRQTAQQNEDN